jgi:hypothetical protein
MRMICFYYRFQLTNLRRLTRTGRNTVLAVFLLAFAPPGPAADESPKKQQSQQEIKKEILRIEKEMKELATRKASLEKNLKPPKQPKSEGLIRGKVSAAFSYQGGTGSNVIGSGSFDLTYSRPDDSFRLEEYLDAKSTKTSSAWRNQVTFTYRRQFLPKLSGLAEVETIYNDGMDKQNAFLGCSFNLVKRELIELMMEAGMGFQYRGAPYLAGMQRTMAEVDLWHVAELDADIKLIFSGDETMRFDLDENRVRLSLGAGRSFKGIKLEAYYRRLDDRRAQDYSLAGIRVGKNFRR